MADKRPVGRPSIFSETVASKIIELGGEGKTDKQICEITGIGATTLDRWKREKENLRWALNKAKAAADELVEASLFHRALGYSHPEEKIFCSEGIVTRVETTQHYPPDATSAIFWLKNRKPKEWRDKTELEVGSTGSITVIEPTSGKKTRFPI